MKLNRCKKCKQKPTTFPVEKGHACMCPCGRVITADTKEAAAKAWNEANR